MVRVSSVSFCVLLTIGSIFDNVVGHLEDDEKPKKPEVKPDIKIEIITMPPKDCTRKSRRLDVLGMKYTGYLENGTKFESTYDHGHEFSFQLGIGQVIQGWEKGLVDMCVGEKRKLTVPPHMAYGTIGAGDRIPPNSTLIFECELVKIDDGPKPANVFKEIDTDGNGELSVDEVSAFLVKTSAEAGEHITAESEEHKKVILSIFEHEDKNKDGVISMAEFSGPKHDEL